MINRIKKWWRNREARIRQEMYFSGFGWAMASYYVDGISFEDLIKDPSCRIAEWDAYFYKGVRDATKTILGKQYGAGSKDLQSLTKAALARIDAMSGEEFKEKCEAAGYTPIWK